MDEVIDDIISLQSSYDDIQAYIDPVQMPNTVSIPPTHTLCKPLFNATSGSDLVIVCMWAVICFDVAPVTCV